MKKFLALVLAMLMVFSLCACGNGGDSGEKVVKIGEDEVVIDDDSNPNGSDAPKEKSPRRILQIRFL